MSIFNTNPILKPKRTAFNLSHENKLTTKFGRLTPTLMQEVLPSDTWKINTESLTRLMPLSTALMHRINVFTHYFFVPNRLIFPDWEDFISPQGVQDEVRPVTPTFYLDNYPVGWENDDIYAANALFRKTSSLLDYVGVNFQNIPPYDAEHTSQSLNLCTSLIKFSMLPFFAYKLIYLEYYADENFIDVRAEKKAIQDLAAQGEIKLSEFESYEAFEAFFNKWFTCENRAFEKDYFTSALTNTQRGDEVALPLGSFEMPEGVVHLPEYDRVTQHEPPVSYKLDEGDIFKAGDSASVSEDERTFLIDNGDLQGGTGVKPISFRAAKAEMDQPVDWLDDPSADINPITINELRRAVKLQEFLEKSARGGYRLIEQIKAHFGVTSSDARLDRPQFLGGDMSKVTISELSQSVSTETDPLGEFGGHGTEIGNTRRRKFFSEEHGWIVCIMSVMPRSSYCQGLSRQFTRFEYLDYAWPEFSHLGEQPVLGRELFVNGSSSFNDAPFGYQSRYAEYKTIPSSIHGAFKGSLLPWTLTRVFDERPENGIDFVEANPDDGSLTRAFSYAGEDDYLLVNLYHNITAIRPLPKFGVPML